MKKCLCENMKNKTNIKQNKTSFSRKKPPELKKQTFCLKSSTTEIKKKQTVGKKFFPEKRINKLNTRKTIFPEILCENVEK